MSGACLKLVTLPCQRSSKEKHKPLTPHMMQTNRQNKDDENENRKESQSQPQTNNATTTTTSAAVRSNKFPQVRDGLWSTRLVMDFCLDCGPAWDAACCASCQTAAQFNHLLYEEEDDDEDEYDGEKDANTRFGNGQGQRRATAADVENITTAVTNRAPKKSASAATATAPNPFADVESEELEERRNARRQLGLPPPDSTTNTGGDGGNVSPQAIQNRRHQQSYNETEEAERAQRRAARKANNPQKRVCPLACGLCLLDHLTCWLFFCYGAGGVGSCGATLLVRTMLRKRFGIDDGKAAKEREEAQEAFEKQRNKLLKSSKSNSPEQQQKKIEELKPAYVPPTDYFSFCEDCCVVFFCHRCAIAQHHREMYLRGMPAGGVLVPKGLTPPPPLQPPPRRASATKTTATTRENGPLSPTQPLASPQLPLPMGSGGDVSNAKQRAGELPMNGGVCRNGDGVVPPSGNTSSSALGGEANHTARHAAAANANNPPSAAATSNTNAHTSNNNKKNTSNNNKNSRRNSPIVDHPMAVYSPAEQSREHHDDGEGTDERRPARRAAAAGGGRGGGVMAGGAPIAPPNPPNRTSSANPPLESVFPHPSHVPFPTASAVDVMRRNRRRDSNHDSDHAEVVDGVPVFFTNHPNADGYETATAPTIAAASTATAAAQKGEEGPSQAPSALSSAAVAAPTVHHHHYYMGGGGGGGGGGGASSTPPPVAVAVPSPNAPMSSHSEGAAFPNTNRQRNRVGSGEYTYSPPISTSAAFPTV